MIHKNLFEVIHVLHIVFFLVIFSFLHSFFVVFHHIVFILAYMIVLISWYCLLHIAREQRFSVVSSLLFYTFWIIFFLQLERFFLSILLSVCLVFFMFYLYTSATRWCSRLGSKFGMPSVFPLTLDLVWSDAGSLYVVL